MRVVLPSYARCQTPFDAKIFGGGTLTNSGPDFKQKQMPQSKMKREHNLHSTKGKDGTQNPRGRKGKRSAENWHLIRPKKQSDPGTETESIGILPKAVFYPI